MVSDIEQLSVESVVEFEDDCRLIWVIEAANIDEKIIEVNSSVPPNVVDSAWDEEQRISLWDYLGFCSTHSGIDSSIVVCI